MIQNKIKVLKLCFVLTVILQSLVGTKTVAQNTTLDTIANITNKVQIAYGVQDVRYSTASVSSVAGWELYKTNTPNLYNTMYGRLTGLTVQQGSSEPGYDSPGISIQGLANYRGSSYKTFVDGFQCPIDQLHPSEIESVTILKDAAALAALGIQGANGAIWVITKHGQKGKTKIAFNLRTGLQERMELPKFTNAYEYAKYYNEAASNDAKKWNPKYTEQAMEAYRLGTNPELYPNVNWYDEVLTKQAPITDADISFSGGNNIAKYFIAGTYTGTKGFYKNTDFKNDHNTNANFNRYNFRANLDLKLNSVFEAAVSLGGRVEDRKFPNYGGSGLWNNMALYPANIYPVQTNSGLWGGNATYPDNPVASVLASGYASTHDRQIQASFSLTQHLDFLLKGLSLKQAVSFSDWGRSNYDMTRDYARYQPVFNGTEVVYSKYRENTDFAINTGTRQQWHRRNAEFSADYKTLINEKGEINSTVLYHQDKYSVDGNEVPYSNENVVGRINYMYDKRYVGELTVSYSGSENFAPGKRYGIFPTLSGAWVMSNESFLSDSKTIDNLKLRASLGQLGNADTGYRFLFQQYYVGGGSNLFGYDNNQYIGSTIEGQLANPDATWEKALKFNVGVDAKLLKKIDLSFDYFIEKRSDILAQTWGAIPGYVGSSLPIVNIGQVTNSGYDLDIKYNDKFGDIEFFAGAKVSFAHNSIDNMGETFRKEEYSKRTGHSIGEYFGLVANGYYDVTDFDANGNLNDGLSVPFFGKVQPGDIRYEDLNKDGVINDDDVKSIGYSWLPEYNFSFNLGAAYKGFDFAMLFQGLANRSVLLSGSTFWAFSNNSAMPEMAKNRWAYYTDEYTGEKIDTRATATYPRLSTMNNPHNYRTSTQWLRNGNVLKLRNIELGYTLPQSLSKKVFIEKARFYINGVNLLSFDAIDGMDAETYTGYPAVKSMNAGISLNF